MMVHPLLGIPLPLHLTLEGIVLVRQGLPLGKAVSDLHVHTSDGQESTEHLNENPTRTTARFLLDPLETGDLVGHLRRTWWGCR